MKKAIGVLALGLLFYIFLLPVPAQIDMSGGWREKDGKIIFQVKIAADQHYRMRSWHSRGNYYLDDCVDSSGKNWKFDLADLMERVNEALESNGIKVEFEITETSEWQAREKLLTIDEAFDDFIVKIPSENNDLVIGLTAFSFSYDNKKAGLCSYNNYILIQDYSPFVFRDGAVFRVNRDSWTLALLLHEIGHFFLGPSHSDNPESIMNEKWLMGFKKEFLREEVEMINKNAVEIILNLRRRK